MSNSRERVIISVVAGVIAAVVVGAGAAAVSCRGRGSSRASTSAQNDVRGSAPDDTGTGSSLVRGEKAPKTPAPPAAGPHADGEWVTPGGDWANTRYSSLEQITADNVKGLQVVSTFSTGVPHGHEGQPLVVGSTMYVVSPYPDRLFALDLARPGTPLLWTYDPLPDPRSVGIACCDVVNRGAAYADGKIVYNLLDANTVAVDAKTGKEVWRTKVGDIDVGETITMAPLIVKNLVIVGDSGGEMGVRGKVVALDLATGEEVWRGYNTGPDVDVKIGPTTKQFYDNDRGVDLGVTSWPPDQWKLGGATVWGWISYDPELDLVYYGTANPGVWNPDLRPGDNKWSCSIFARSLSDGTVRWVHQLLPHDEWDFDEIMENILVDLPIDGVNRKLLLHAGRTGFVFAMDRETGEVISAEKFEPINFASGVDKKTGTPIINEDKRTHFGVDVKGICPSSTGAKEVFPAAFSPKTSLLYIPAHNTCMDYEGMEASYIAGTPYLGARVKMYPGSSEYQGEMIAWDPARAKKVWSKKEPKLPLNGGSLVTAGDVVFYGTMDGWFKAIDARTGADLWKFKTASGIVGNPITYLAPDGKQYVAVYAGVGGWMGAVAFPAISADDTNAALGVVGAMKDIKNATAPGDVLYVFGLSAAPSPAPSATSSPAGGGAVK